MGNRPCNRQKGTKPAILTLVERKTRKSIYILIKDKTKKEVLSAIKKAHKKLGGDSDDVIKTITADNGSEFSDSEGIKEVGKCSDVFMRTFIAARKEGATKTATECSDDLFPKEQIYGQYLKIDYRKQKIG